MDSFGNANNKDVCVDGLIETFISLNINDISFQLLSKHMTSSLRIGVEMKVTASK